MMARGWMTLHMAGASRRPGGLGRLAKHALAAAAVVLVMSLAPVAGGVAHALSPKEQLKDAALEARARELSAELRCLVCQNQSIDDSDAPLAQDLRRLVRERIVAGDSNAEVKSFLVERYGDFVLLKPPFAAHTLLLWLAPFLVLALTVFYVVHAARSRKDPAVASASRLSADEEARLAELMKAGPAERETGPEGRA